VGDDQNEEEGAEQGGGVEIVQISCPKCKTVIRRSYRYMALLNQRTIDIQMVFIDFD
jgi:hypothetical protein